VYAAYCSLNFLCSTGITPIYTFVVYCVYVKQYAFDLGDDKEEVMFQLMQKTTRALGAEKLTIGFTVMKVSDESDRACVSLWGAGLCDVGAEVVFHIYSIYSGQLNCSGV